jgi:2'-5' RNA ligase
VLAVEVSAGGLVGSEGTVEGLDALGALQARVAVALVAGGWYAAERRPFLAHVTVARIQGGGSRPGMAGGRAPATPEDRFEAGHVALIRSHLGAGPARYERLAVFALSPTR